MIDTTVTKPTLAGVFWKEESANRWIRRIALALLGTGLLTLSAKVQVPFWPVPMTMQTMVVLMIGMAFGWRLGAATVLLYLAEGAAGLPVFAGTPEKGLGLAYMVGPTGGYLVGFVLAAAVTGWLAERGLDRNVLTTAAVMLIGTIAIYLPGAAWLTALIGFEKALQFGVTPFLLADGAKLVLAACLMPLAWKALKRK